MEVTVIFNFFKCLFILAAWNVSFSLRDLRSSLWHSGSLVVEFEIWFPELRLNPGPHEECRVSATGPSRKSLSLWLLICIFLMTENAEYFLICLCVIWTSSLVMWVFKYFAHFQVGRLFLCCYRNVCVEYKWYIDIQTYDICLGNLFYQTVTCCTTAFWKGILKIYFIEA